MSDSSSVYPEHAAKMRAGLACGAEGCGVTLNKKTREKHGFQVNDYVYVASPDQATLVCRQLRALPFRGITGPDYLYMDCDTMHLLNVDLHAPLLVWKADYDMDMP